MAAILTIAKGHDAAYPWKQIGTADPAARPAADRGTGYYLSPAERGGEPPGIWTGTDVAELGLPPGGVVDRAVFEPLYGHHLDPRDPSGQARLGRAPRRFCPAEQIYAGLLAAEPEATAERRAQLMTEAKAQVRTADLYWDATFSVSKSVSLLHASALANAAAAHERGDPATAADWQQAADGIWAAIMEGNAAALEYLQAEAGQTRAGYHPGGRWEDARQWVIASFRQHTSRDGDPQLHVHNLILHKVRRESDGEWRALDSMSLYRQRPAASAIGALVMETALTRRFGVQWVPRRDGHGREIAGTPAALMEMFSSRRRSIGPLTERLAGAYQAQYGRAPDARALASLRQWANHATRRGKDTGALDLAALVRQWSRQAGISEAGALEPLAPAVMTRNVPGRPGAGEPAHNSAPARQPALLVPDQEQRLIQEAVAAVQAAQPTWTEADLIRHLGERLPAQAAAPASPDAAATLLPDLARRALAAEAVLLSAPEWPRVPDCLRRASGESLYIPHGAAHYTTRAQLALEDQLLADAGEAGAPRLDPVTAARLLGADRAQLEAQLRAPGTSPDATGALTGAGLRLDQAAAAWAVLTSARRAEVLAGPAGSGKTRTVAELARLWRAAGMGEVIGLTTSQAAATVLAAAGVTRAYNTARFLGHLPGAREALGPLPIARGSLLIVDEASMMSLPDLAAILALARARGCKVIITGDHEQLAAVEGGGAMMLLARRQGYVQLTEPQRFTAAWERDATLRLRAGDLTVLTDYEQHGRLRGGTPEEATEQACQGWLADHLDGRDTVLMARTEEQARELSRRAREYLIRYHIVAAGPQVRLAHGERASRGDLIMARRNISAADGEQPGNGLDNRDILQITTVDSGPAGTGARVRLLLGRHPKTGQPRWSASFWLPGDYLARHATLAYATTQYATQGRTTDTAHVLVDGLGDRQGLYMAMSRGRDANHAYCITDCPRSADTRPGSVPAAELERVRRLTRERTELPARPGQDQHRGRPALDPVSVMAGVLQRDGSELSATETLQQALSHADHLGVLGGIWDDLIRRDQHARFTAALRQALPADLAEQALNDRARTWLWRTLREAEAAGHDGSQILGQAIAVRSMNGARDVARVLDARLRQMLDGTQPQLPARWADRVPETADPEMRRYLLELAQAIEDRIRRLGEHAARTQPQWARQALGPVPADPAARLDWESKATMIAAYRERYGYSHPADPIGPAPGKTSPEARALWHAAMHAIGSPQDADLRGCTDGELWLRRSAYERETAGAPPHVGNELRLIRITERDAHVNAVRADHEARAAADAPAAERHRELARLWRSLEAKAAAEAELFAEVQETRRQWETVTETTRHTAIAADLELRRRHPGLHIEPLRPHPAESAGLLDTPGTVGAQQTGDSTQLNLDHAAPAQLAQPPAGQGDPAASRQGDAKTLLTLGLTPETAQADIPARVSRIRENARLTQAKLEELAHLPLPGATEHDPSPSPAWSLADSPHRDAVLQPPHPDIIPSDSIVTHYQAIRENSATLESERC